MPTKLPKVKQLRKFLELATERQKIYLKRQAGEPWPWTKNELFLKFKFCNCYREQDRVTKWIRENWREPYATHSNLWFAMCIARMINWPDTLALIGFPETWEPKRVLECLKWRMGHAQKTFTSAYLLGGGNNFGISKAEFIVYKVLDPVWKDFHKEPRRSIFDGSPTLKETWEWLCSFYGWGKFLAYEVVTDLRHTRYLNQASDIMSWASIGPGCRRGLNRIYERDLKATGQSDEKLLEELLLITQWVIENKDPKILPTWEPRDTEMWKCEYDKICRAEERLTFGMIVGLERYYQPSII